MHTVMILNNLCVSASKLTSTIGAKFIWDANIITKFNQGVCTFGSHLIGHGYDMSEITLHINIHTGVSIK
jgi:hypothetical protein